MALRAPLTLAGLLLLSPQMHPGQPVPQPTPKSRYGRYGPPRVMALSEIARAADNAPKRVVRTRGDLEFLEAPGSPYLELDDGTARVVIIPTNELQGDVRTLIGRRVEVVGLVRVLQPPRTSDCPLGHWSLCEDPDLPPLPDLTPDRIGWPRVSITVWNVSDVTPLEGRRRRSDGASALAALVTKPEDYAGRTLTVVGRFRGRNLFGDLPAGSALTAKDWVLRAGCCSIWVTGKQPKGDGFSLDLDSKGDCRWWLAVEGKPLVHDGVVVLKARRVSVTKPPPGFAEASPP